MVKIIMVLGVVLALVGCSSDDDAPVDYGDMPSEVATDAF